MLKIEVRQMFRSNGLIDDLVVYGEPEDYLSLAKSIELALSSGEAVIQKTSTDIKIEITLDNDEADELFTSLQNESDEYYSMEQWNSRKILRVIGDTGVLTELRLFLIDLSGRGEGYSYLSAYSDKKEYSVYSPEVRLHV